MIRIYEQNFQITAAVTTTHYWIGLTDHFKEGDFFWGESGTEISSEIASHWANGEPNNHGVGEDCVEVWGNHMNDRNCERNQKFVCQYRLE